MRADGQTSHRLQPDRDSTHGHSTHGESRGSDKANPKSSHAYNAKGERSDRDQSGSDCADGNQPYSDVAHGDNARRPAALLSGFGIRPKRHTDQRKFADRNVRLIARESFYEFTNGLVP